MPRKGGKSSLGSAMALYSLILGPSGGEVYSVAAEKEQARIVFREARRMVEANEQLSGLCTLYRDAIEIPALHSVYRVLSAEAFSKEGLNPHFVLFDELHAQPNRELFDVMSLAMGARGKLASLVAITTAGVKTDSTGRDSIAYSLYNYGKKVASGEIEDPTFFISWWEAPEDLDFRSEEAWEIANPGFGDLTSIEDFRSAVRRTPEAEFRTKRLNSFVSSAISWLPSGAWEACQRKIAVSPDDEIVLGFDGSFSGDASVIVGAVIPKENEPVKVFLVKAWEKQEDDDDDWRVDIADVENTIIEFCKTHRNVREIACDPFRWQRSMEVLEGYGLPIVEWPSTSARRMVPACAKFYDAVMEGTLIHDGDPILARHIENAVTKIDALGPRIVKEKRNSNRKIDAAVAAVLAVDRATVARIETPIPQFFS
jgi:phage terminase large subunit-like protein